MSNYHANSEERDRFIAGLRELADFLSRNPQVPVPHWATVIVFPDQAADTEMVAEIDRIAGHIGATASRTDDTPAAHYAASRYFGPVEYRAVAIPEAARTPRKEA